MSSELVLRNGTVVTMRSEKGRAQAVAVDRGRITAVGTEEEILPLVGPGTEVIDLQGKALLPGLIDCHVHFVPTGLGALVPSLKDCATLVDVLDIVASLAARAARDEAIWVHGFDHLALPEARFPTREELDRVAPHNPAMVMHRGMHSMVLNTRAWELVNLPEDTAGIKRDPGTGKPTGLLMAQANTAGQRLFSNLVDDATKLKGLHQAAGAALAAGVTTIHSLDGGLWAGDRDIHLVRAERARLPIKVVPYYQTPDVGEAVALGLDRIGGCLWVDGSLSEHTAAFFEPYQEDPTTRGVLYFTQEETNQYVLAAHEAGLQISRHAIGDAAIEQMLAAHESALARFPRADHRHRIEHFSFATEEQIERAARLGIVPVYAPIVSRRGVPLEPGFAYHAVLLGEERARRWRVRVLRKLLQRGMLVAGGSDSDCSPIDPLAAVHALANLIDPSIRLTPFEALLLHTVNAARVGLEEKEKGLLAPGLAADLVVLDRDPLAVPPSDILDLRVEMTIVDGKVVHS